MIEIYLDHFDAQLFPLRKRTKLGDPNCKRPLHEAWQTRKYSREELVAYWEAGHPIGWALGDNDLVVDIDAASEERPDKQGLDSLKKLNNGLKGFSQCNAVEVISPNGGKHIYMTKPEGKIRKSIAELPGIDFLTKGAYVVIAGSPHWQGGVYQFGEMTQMFGDYGRSAAPVALIDMLRRNEMDVDEDDASVVITPATLEAMLSELEPESYSTHDDWFRIFAASHSATGGSLEGMEVFVNWSTSDPVYSGAGEEIRNRWRTLKHKEGGITIGTLFEELKRWGRLDVVRKVRAQLDFDAVEPRAQPTVVGYGFNEKEVNDKIIHALGKCPNLFQRNGGLVSIADTHIQPLNALNVCELISSTCILVSHGDKEPKPIRVPERVGRQIVGRGAWFGIPALKGIVTTPVFTTSGLLQTPGYDVKSGVFYKPTIDVPAIPESPSQADAAAALGRIKELVVDFPFLNDAHRSNWLAALLTLIARHAIDGPVPLFLIDGNQPGIGKSLLVNLAATIAYGQVANNGPLSDENEEVAKLLLSIAVQGYGAYCFDNLKNGADFGCAALDAVLTGRSVSGRILGQSKVADAELDTVFFATGNRVGISKESDSFRRVAIISLQSKSEDPKARTNFRFGCDSALLSHALANRAGILRDCLIVLQAASKAELPAVKGWGSYSAFSNIIRRPLVWLGEPDPIESREDVLMYNEDAEELQAVVNGLLQVFGEAQYRTAGEIYTELRNHADAGDDSAKHAVDSLAPEHFREPARAVGKRLKTRFRDRPIGGFWIKSKKDGHRNQLTYGVEKT